MADRTIVLTEEDAARLDRLVRTAGYRDAAEAMHESLKLAELAQGSEPMRAAALQAAIQAGLDDVAAGRVTTLRTPRELNRFLDNLLAEPLDETNG